ncbi:CPBP family intramembrane glutamic endopeptidase [Bifidobacterium catulorum]|nr:CPBP family intramembrane glutamic endopeptidase [Bifidobacterium catulorum]
MIRADDLMADDHPVRRFDGARRIRSSALLRALVFICIMTFVSGLTVGLARSNSMETASFGELVGAVAAYLIVVLVMEERRAPVELAPSRAFDLIRGMAASFACIAICIGIVALLGGYRIVGFDPGYSPWSDLLVLGFTAGIAEEIMMRGMLLRLVEESLGSWGAVVVSALVFGLVHIANPDGTLWGGMAIAIEAGLLFGAIYLATRSLWWCIGFHFMWNIAEGPVFGSIVSGTGARRSWLVAQWQGPDLLTGGAFGLEASIVPVVLLGSLAIATLVHLQRLGRMIEPVWIRRKRLGNDRSAQSV